MKLTKETRDQVKIGALLKSDSESYMVTNIWEAGKGKCITVKIMEMADPKNQCWIGHNVYGRPLSEYYGLEVELYER